MSTPLQAMDDVSAPHGPSVARPPGGAALARLRRQSPVVQIGLFVGAVVFGSLIHVHLHLQLIHASYAVARETRLRDELEEQRRKLELELAMRRDPAIIAQRAREELGMAPPDPGSIRPIALSGVPPRALPRAFVATGMASDATAGAAPGAASRASIGASSSAGASSGAAAGAGLGAGSPSGAEKRIVP